MTLSKFTKTNLLKSHTIALILASISSICSIDTASALTLMQQTVQNGSGGAASDLHIRFDQPANRAGIKIGNNSFPSTANSPDNLSYDFDNFGIVNRNQRVDIRWETNCAKCGIVAKDSYWTIKDAQGKQVNVGGYIQVGAPKVIRRNSPLSVTFYNPETVSVTYNDIQLFEGNDISNFNLFDFTTPTGTLVSGLPSSITLNPGEFNTITFSGIIEQPSTYILSTASVFRTTNPTDAFSVAAAYDFGEEKCLSVPEPASIFGLLLFGTLGTGAALKRKNLNRLP